jgi:hypothetical protein
MNRLLIPDSSVDCKDGGILDESQSQIQLILITV